MERTILKEILFSELKECFISMGFTEKQIILMNDITAGDYLVANPSINNLPRILCLLNVKNILKIECGQIKAQNYSTVRPLFYLNLFKNSNISDYTLIDEASGFILDDSDIDELSYDKVKSCIEENLEDSNVFKFEFYCEYMDNKESDEKKTSPVSMTTEDIIIQFMKTKNNIQSGQLMEIFPDWSKSDALMRLKSMKKKKIILQKGSWFKLP